MDAVPVPADALPACPEAAAVASLLEAFNHLLDPRKARGIRYPLGGTLALCVVAFVCGRQTLSGAMRFGQAHPGLLRQLGFSRSRAPSVPTLSRLLAAVDVEDFQHVVSAWLAALIAGARRRQGLAAASVDGKTSRAAGVHLLNVFLHDLEQVVWQAPVGDKQNEISAFKQALAGLLAAYPFLALIVGDALFAGEPLCQLLVSQGRHWLFQIKADQPELLEKMRLVFAAQLKRPAPAGKLTGEKKSRLQRGA